MVAFPEFKFLRKRVHLIEKKKLTTLQRQDIWTQDQKDHTKMKIKLSQIANGVELYSGTS